MFHNSDDAVWSSLERAIEAADLPLESAIAFDKTQPSFKGVKQITDQERVSSFDLVLHLRAAAATGATGTAAPAVDAQRCSSTDHHTCSRRPPHAAARRPTSTRSSCDSCSNAAGR